MALRAGSSARHISFVETGRSRPSEEMVLRLAEHLDVPVRERNALLLAAGYAPGYAPHYPQTPFDDPSTGAPREGMERLIQGYEPYPALVMNATYDVLAANRGIVPAGSSRPGGAAGAPPSGCPCAMPSGHDRLSRYLGPWGGVA